MIYTKNWRKYRGLRRYNYIGWFLFGFIPLYVKREEY